LQKKSAIGFQKQVKFRLPEGKGKNRRQILKVYRQYKYVILVASLFLLVLVFITIEKTFSPLSIKKINTQNFTLTDTDKVELIGKKIYFVNQDNLNQKLLPNHIDIKAFTLEKQYPETIKVIAKKRKGVFKIINNKSYYIIDDEGVIFSQVKKSKLPDLPVDVKDITIGTRLDQQDLYLYTNVVKQLLDLKLEIDKVYLEGEFIYVTIKGKYKIRFEIDKYLSQIEMFRKAIIQIQSAKDLIEVSFVDNKVLMQYSTPR